MTDTETIHEFAVKNLLPEKYLLGELKDADLEDFEQHMWECSTCFDEVKLGMAFKQSIAAGVAAPRKSWWQRIKEFWTRPAKANALLLFFVQLGPGRVPPPPGSGFISLQAAIVFLAFFSGIALGAWTIVWIGRRVNRYNIAAIEHIRQTAERAGFDRGYASALGVQAEINAPQQRKGRG
jgi:hypothetical protein